MPGIRPDTLERLLSYCADLSGPKQALCDPPNRARLEGRSDAFSPRVFTFKNLDDTVSRLAARFTALGLLPGDNILLQLPNFTDTPILVLALMRARLIPCLIPLSWTVADISRSFERLKPKALVSCGQMEGINHSETMRELAFSHIHVRFVLGAGYDIADGVTDITSLLDPQPTNDGPEFSPPAGNQRLSDLALVTYIDPVTPVPHTNGQILASGLLHVLSLELSSNDHILSAYPLSSIPGLTAHFYPWLISACSLSLHQPFDLQVLHEQLQSQPFSFFAAPQQIVEYLLRFERPIPQKIAIVRRKAGPPFAELEKTPPVQFFDLWNFDGLGSIPMYFNTDPPTGLFTKGRLYLPKSKDRDLCLAVAKIFQDRLFIKGRIFPQTSSLKMSLEWISLKKRLHEDWLDTGLAAVPGPDNSIQLVDGMPVETNHATPKNSAPLGARIA